MNGLVLHKEDDADPVRYTIEVLDFASKDTKPSQVTDACMADELAEHAIERLKKPDIEVTNQRDKQIQLSKLEELDKEVAEKKKQYAGAADQSKAEIPAVAGLVSRIGSFIRGHRGAVES